MQCPTGAYFPQGEQTKNPTAVVGFHVGEAFNGQPASLHAALVGTATAEFKPYFPTP